MTIFYCAHQLGESFGNEIRRQKSRSSDGVVFHGETSITSGRNSSLEWRRKQWRWQLFEALRRKWRRVLIVVTIKAAISRRPSGKRARLLAATVCATDFPTTTSGDRRLEPGSIACFHVASALSLLLFILFVKRKISDVSGEVVRKFLRR